MLALTTLDIQAGDGNEPVEREAVKKPKPRKKEKPSATTLAFREYERVSYYLATVGNFDFTVDDTAREAFWNGDTNIINLCIANRLSPDEGQDFKVPAGDHITPGLALRTNERERIMKKSKKAKGE